MPGSFIADDCATFVNTDEFGSDAEYRCAFSGEVVDITGIFDNPFQAVDVGAGMKIASSMPTYQTPSASLPDGAAQGDTVSVNSVEWLVCAFEPDETGFTLLTLEKKNP